MLIEKSLMLTALMVVGHIKGSCAVVKSIGIMFVCLHASVKLAQDLTL